MHLKMIKRLQITLAKHNKNNQKCLAMLKMVDDKKWILSYHSFINIFNCIGNYNFTKDKHEKNKFLSNIINCALSLISPYLMKSIQ
jgi:hypothetical protein